jgi:hypothetical protein
MRSKLLRFTISCSVFRAILLASTSPGSAATFTVTDFGDSGASGKLRTLITQAASGDTIVIPAGTITLTGAAGEDANASGEPDILKETGLLRARNKVPVSGHHFPSG